MNKARKKFVLSAMLAIFVLLSALLGIINGVNYTMAGEDADAITRMLADQNGAFQFRQGGEGDGMRMDMTRDGRPPRSGPMGPESPEMSFSLRYFTFAFDEKGNGERVAWQISAVTEEDALAWAKSLLNEKETGWTGMTYRYRVYEQGNKKFVTVIDQGRELLPAYRIFIISLIGLGLCLVISGAALTYIGKRLFYPLEEADRKQKRFIADVEKEFKVPLTIMNANTEIIEREMGETGQTQSINRQVRRMTALVKDLATFAVFDEKDLSRGQCDLSALAMAAADEVRAWYGDRGDRLQLDAGEHITVTGDSEALGDMLTELADNAVKFAGTWARLTVTRENGRVRVVAANDTGLPDGPADQAMDRFTRLDNARDLPGAGLGLSRVKEIVRFHNGRVNARVVDGVFTLTVNL